MKEEIITILDSIYSYHPDALDLYELLIAVETNQNPETRDPRMTREVWTALRDFMRLAEEASNAIQRAETAGFKAYTVVRSLKDDE